MYRKWCGSAIQQRTIHTRCGSAIQQRTVQNVVLPYNNAPYKMWFCHINVHCTRCGCVSFRVPSYPLFFLTVCMGVTLFSNSVHIVCLCYMTLFFTVCMIWRCFFNWLDWGSTETLKQSDTSCSKHDMINCCMHVVCTQLCTHAHSRSYRRTRQGLYILCLEGGLVSSKRVRNTGVLTNWKTEFYINRLPKNEYFCI